MLISISFGNFWDVSGIFLILNSRISQALKTPRGPREVSVQPSPLIPTVRFPHLIKKVIQDFSSKPQQLRT